MYVHGNLLVPCPEPTTDLILRIFKACNGWGYAAGGLNKTDIWLVLEMTARRGHISFKGKVRGGGLRWASSGLVKTPTFWGVRVGTRVTYGPELPPGAK